MSRAFSYALSISLLSTCFALAPFATSLAATRAERTELAKQLVAEALHHTTMGLESERERLLEAALNEIPQYAPAMWHRGYLRVDGQWLHADSLTQTRRSNNVARYEHLRKELGDTAADHLKLADWCARHQLPDQERAHLFRVLDHDPQNTTARQRLGFRQVRGIWMSEEDLQAVEETERQRRRALSKWQSRLTGLRNELSHRSRTRRERAVERIRAIDDPDAIWVMELVLSPHSQQAAELVVASLSGMTGPEVARSLARHATLSPWESVRAEAARQLKGHSYEAYVPMLLAWMYKPVQTQTEVVREPGGRFVYRHSFLREGQHQHELLVLETEYERMAMPAGDGSETLGRAMVNMAVRAASREIAVWQQNAQAEQLNARVAETLSVAAGTTLAASADECWKWWNDYNEVYVGTDKPTYALQQSDQVTLVDQIGGSAQRSDCLLAGTPIWTAGGPVPVEEIRVGDLVVAQDPASGQLQLKPVLATTLRPVGQLIRIHAGEDILETSGGHLFWVAGHGWVKARDLQPGMLLHGMTSTTVVSEVESGSVQPTHNLVVADWNTFFVGRQKILSHDNTMHEPLNTAVPGLPK